MNTYVCVSIQKRETLVILGKCLIVNNVQGPDRLWLPGPHRDCREGRRGDRGRARRGLGLQPRLLD